MAIAFEHHTGLAGVPPRTENPAVFVAAFNVTFLAAAALSMAAVATSAALGDRRRVSPGLKTNARPIIPAYRAKAEGTSLTVVERARSKLSARGAMGLNLEEASALE